MTAPDVRPPAGPVTPLEAWRQDLAAYPAKAFLREPSIYAVLVLRLGQAMDAARLGPLAPLLRPAYWLAFRLLEVALGVSITKDTRIGPGLRIYHFGGIFVNERSTIGARCTLRQGVTIGDRRHNGPAPVLGDDVELGAYAQVLGGVRVGDGARIGAATVVLQDVPAGAVAVGNPARILERERSRS